jgi:DNA-binding PadR family transcriptional regulator
MSVNKHIKPSTIDLGLLQMQILWLLSKKPMHGYILMKELDELKRTKITQGTLYPTLQKLERLKLIKSQKKDRTIVYHVTKNGKQAMRENCHDFCRTFSGIIHDFVCGKCNE